MVKYYRALALFILTASAYMSWKHGLYQSNSLLYIANRHVPWGIYLGWGFLVCFIILLFDIATTTVYRIHRRMCPIRTMTLIVLAFGWAGTVMLSPHKWAIIIPYSLLSLGAIGLTIADGVRKNRRGLRYLEKGEGEV